MPYANSLEAAIPMRRVLIIQAQIKHYRVPFFTKLYEELQCNDIELHVAYSTPPPSELKKNDNSDLPGIFSTRVRGYWTLHERLLYQPLACQIANADFVIAEHANRHIMNHWLLLLRTARLKRFALWGLGLNKQVDQVAMSEWFKKQTTKRANAYFAYTSSVGREVEALGMPKERIIVVQNATDTRELRDHVASIGSDELGLIREKLGIGKNAKIGLFCGMLDPVKGVPFLIECVKLIKLEVPEFHLILMGGGPDREKIRGLIAECDWVHAIGPKFGREKALFFRLSDALLLPGRVGLVILDSFAAGLPLLTVRIPIHGPEIDYLEEGVNGFITENERFAYAKRVVCVLKSPGLLQQMKAGALRAAERYTIEAMVDNYRAGVIQSLGLPAVG